MIIVGYRPPNGNGNSACEDIKNYIKSIEAIDRKEIVLMGDLNWDFLEVEMVGHKIIREMCDQFGLTQEITRPTRVTERKSSLIDVVLPNARNINYTGCINYNMSNHCPVVVVKKRVAADKNISTSIGGH